MAYPSSISLHLAFSGKLGLSPVSKRPRAIASLISQFRQRPIAHLVTGSRADSVVRPRWAVSAPRSGDPCAKTGIASTIAISTSMAAQGSFIALSSFVVVMPNVRREPRANLGASVSTARLGGRRLRSQIFGPQPCAFGDAGKHFGANRLAIVKGKDDIRPAGTGESLMRSGLALERSSNPEQCGKNTAGLRRRS